MNNRDQQLKSLTERNDELENYFRNTIIPQLYIDTDLILRKFTPPAMKQFKLSKDDIGKSIHDIENNFRFPSVIENIQRVIESGEILEKEVQTTDSGWYQMNILPYVKQTNNKIDGVIITFIDITLRIRDLKEQEQLISEYETLIDTISHDIRNPLTSLLLTTEVVNTKLSEYPDHLKRPLKIIENGVQKLQTIIYELTNTRKQGQRYKTVDELLDFEQILEDVRLTLLYDSIELDKILKTEFNIIEITFSRRKLRSILYNLLSNAIKYKSPDRKLEIIISTIQEGNFVILSVKDNGIGIDASKHDDIFLKYYRVSDSVEGSGIGLHLVKEIVNHAGGKIELKSQLDVGTEVNVYLKAI